MLIRILMKIKLPPKDGWVLLAVLPKAEELLAPANRLVACGWAGEAPNKDDVVCCPPNVDVTPKELVVGFPKADWANGEDVVTLLKLPKPAPVVVEPKFGLALPNMIESTLNFDLLSQYFVSD